MVWRQVFVLIAMFVYFTQSASFAPDQVSLEAHWEGFNDSDSGLRSFHVALLKQVDCSENASTEIVVESIEIDAKYSSYKFLEINLEVICN